MIKLNYAMRTFWAAIAFCLANAVIRRLASPHLAMDDAKTNVFTQTWAWGYQPDNPPLFEWLVKLVHPFTANDLSSFLLVKYGSIVLAAMLLFIAVRQIAESRHAFWVSVGAVLLYQVGWNAHGAFTHTALLLPAITGSIAALIFAARKPGLWSPLLLGVAMGASLLAKYNAALFWVGALGAAAFSPKLRVEFLRPHFLLTPLVAGLLITPHAVWFLQQSDAYEGAMRASLGIDQSSHLARAGSGLASLIVASLLFLTPWALVVGVLGRKYRLPNGDWPATFVRISAVSLGALALAIPIFGIADVSERYLIPVLLPLYIGVTLTIVPKLDAGAFRAFRYAILLTAVTVTGVRALMVASPGPPFCSDCRQFIPYDALVPAVLDNVPTGSILVAREENTGGNLVNLFPDKPVRVFTSLHFAPHPVEDTSARPCFLVWSTDMVDAGTTLEPPIAHVPDDPSTVLVRGTWARQLRGEDAPRLTRWGITPLTSDRLRRAYCNNAEG